MPDHGSAHGCIDVGRSGRGRPFDVFVVARANRGAGKIRRVADLLADVRRVRQVADVCGPASTALSMRKVAERALEHDDEEVRRLANQLLAELERSPALRRRR
jgi:hypothetical protein